MQDIKNYNLDIIKELNNNNIFIKEFYKLNETNYYYYKSSIVEYNDIIKYIFELEQYLKEENIRKNIIYNNIKFNKYYKKYENVKLFNYIFNKIIIVVYNSENNDNMFGEFIFIIDINKNMRIEKLKLLNI